MVISFLMTDILMMCVFFRILLLPRKNNASCYNSTLWAEIKLFQYPMLSLISVTLNWPAFTPSLRDNSLMFLGTVSPYFQSTESRQSNLTLEFMCERTVVQTWSICIVHLLDHSDWFDSGMVMWFKLIKWYSTLGVDWTVEEEKLRNCIYWGCLPLQDEQTQTSRVHHIMSQSENEASAEEGGAKWRRDLIPDDNVCAPRSIRAWS